jgi:hypothetical protein
LGFRNLPVWDLWAQLWKEVIFKDIFDHLYGKKYQFLHKGYIKKHNQTSATLTISIEIDATSISSTLYPSLKIQVRYFLCLRISYFRSYNLSSTTNRTNNYYGLSFVGFNPPFFIDNRRWKREEWKNMVCPSKTLTLPFSSTTVDEKGRNEKIWSVLRRLWPSLFRRQPSMKKGGMKNYGLSFEDFDPPFFVDNRRWKREGPPSLFHGQPSMKSDGRKNKTVT